MKNILLTFTAITLFSFTTQSQSVLLHESSVLEHEFIERMEIKSGKFSDQLFTSLKPFPRKNAVRFLEQSDTTISDLSATDKAIIERFLANNPEWKTQKQSNRGINFLNTFYEYPVDFFRYEEEGLFVTINPVMNIIGTYDKSTEEIPYINQRGAEIRGLINDRVGFYSFVADNQSFYTRYVEEKITEQDGAIPGEGWHKPFGDGGYDYFSVKGYLTFKLLPNIDVQFGQDKNMIGNGMRSLFLSNYSNDYMFLKLNTQFNRFKYQNIFAEYVDFPIRGDSGRRYDRKFGTTHYLTARVTDNFRLGLFETVTFGRVDSVNQRSYEAHYANPVIFYRAIEHQLGDPDKVAIGLDWQWLIASRLSFYGQIYVDDFYLKDVRQDVDSLLVRVGLRSDRKYENYASFRNKFGLQAGLKWIDFFGISNLDLQFESNLVRPYTYTHFNSYVSSIRPSASYTNYSQALAHPIGANFSEQAGRITYRYRSDLAFSIQAFKFKQGRDNNGVNYGANILNCYTTRPEDYGMTFLQGDLMDVTLVDFMVSWEFLPNMFVDLSTMIRNEKLESRDEEFSDMFLSLTFRWNSFPIKHYF